MHVITHDRRARADLSALLAAEREDRYGRLHDCWDTLDKQQQRLEGILNLAFRNSTYYANLAINTDFSLCGGRAVFNRLPLLTRSLYATNLADLKVAVPHLCYQDHTSGTSGAPIEVFRDSKSLFLESQRFADILQYYAADSECATLRPLTIIYVSHYQTSDEHIYADPVLGASVLKIRCDIGNVYDRAEKYGFFLQQHRYVLTGTVSSLLYLANTGSARLDLPTPALILPSGEALPPAVRGLLQGTLGAPVFELYTLRECGTLAFQCRCGKALHVQDDWFILEALDRNGHAVPDGVAGELVVTDLGNQHVPLLRYATGDFGSIHWGRCACGLHLSSLSELTGRRPVQFVAGNGDLIDTAHFAKALDRLPILWYRVTQYLTGDVGLEYRSLVQEPADGLIELCEELQCALGLDRPITARLVTIDEALLQGKTGGFFSEL
jgi:phenylacetate-CoA ligase